MRDDSPAARSPNPLGDGSTIAQAPILELPPEETTPSEIGGYRLQRLLGVGGMGRVFEAESIATGQKVAVKLLSMQLARHATSVERFRQEGQLASQLSHPRCVFVLAADTENGRPYIVMELMPGDTLKDMIERRGPLPAQDAIHLILDAIDGLREAHRFGVIHRDVKPSNCFLMPDGHVKIGDFGLSKSLGANAQLTISGAFLGTVLYASPEQIRGEPVEYASDVYSVCATLYEMLAGRPPFQHENITAALAKIISEDAPPIRSVKHDVPRALAKIVEKGLERDRNRRWQTLEELRAALVSLVPSHLTYGGLTIRVGAYLLDEFFVRLLAVLPLSAISHAILGTSNQRYLPLFVFPCYFVLFEGLFGASIGKRILRLRVCKTGSTDPPGLKRAAIRTLTFYLMLFPARVLFEEGGGGWTSLLLSAVPFVAGLLLLIVPMRRSNDFTGMHEMVSGTCVMKLPRRVRPLALISERGNRLQSLPPVHDPLPRTVGPYAIKGALAIAHGEFLLIGEDSLLNRRILVRIRPGTNDESFPKRVEINRPTRPRALLRGKECINEMDFLWEAFVAPAGAAFGDVVAAHGQLTWPETRPLLEQLAEELHAAETDGTLPDHLSIDQIWVQRDGRLQLLEFPVPRPGEAAPAASGSALGLLRDVGALSLEGGIRSADTDSSESIRAPVPLHAAKLIDRLFGGANSFPNVDAFRSALAATRDLPTHVDHSLRIAHLTVQAVSLAIGITAMFLIAGLFAVLMIVDREQSVRGAKQIMERLDRPEDAAAEIPDPRLSPYFADETKLRKAIARQMNEDEAESERFRTSLNAIERSLLALIAAPDSSLPPDVELETLERAMPSISKRQPSFLERLNGWRDACGLILFWPLAWALGAFAFRGGLSYQILGIGIVNRDGRRASRKRSALRALAVWLPVGLFLCASVWVQAQHPARVYLHTAMWLSAFFLLPAYVALAMLDPDRAPHDRLLKTRLVPR